MRRKAKIFRLFWADPKKARLSTKWFLAEKLVLENNLSPEEAAKEINETLGKDNLAMKFNAIRRIMRS